MAKKLKCWICGAEHDYCPTCGDTHGWKYVADTHEHYQIYLVMNDFRSGIITKEEANDLFAKKCDIRAENDLSWMIPEVETYIREIIGEKNKTNKTTKKSKLFKD